MKKEEKKGKFQILVGGSGVFNVCPNHLSDATACIRSGIIYGGTFKRDVDKQSKEYGKALFGRYSCAQVNALARHALAEQARPPKRLGGGQLVEIPM